MVRVMFLYFRMQQDDVLEHKSNAKHHFCTL